MSWIGKNVALLHPIYPTRLKAELDVPYMGRRPAIFLYFHEGACDNVFIFKQTWRLTQNTQDAGSDISRAI